MAAKSGVTYESLMAEIRAGQFRPVYLLYGEENYYIDRLVEAIENHALTEEEKAFNLMVYYGLDADVNAVVNSARTFPMGAARSVVELREAQAARSLDAIAAYMQNPQPTTVLVITYKAEKVDARKKWVTSVSKGGAVFESAKLKNDSQLPPLISSYVRQHGFKINDKAITMISQAVGRNIAHLFGELDKLFVSAEQFERIITPELVEKNIGISKDFNYYELQDALIRRDVFKANQIVRYFDKNPKVMAVPQLTSMFFGFFSNLMQAHYAPDKSDRGVAAYLGLSEWQVRNGVLPALRVFSARKVLGILGKIREVDAISKGLGQSSATPGELMTELIHYILH